MYVFADHAWRRRQMGALHLKTAVLVAAHCSSCGWCVNCPSNPKGFTFSDITSSALWSLQPAVQS